MFQAKPAPAQRREVAHVEAVLDRKRYAVKRSADWIVFRLSRGCAGFGRKLHDECI
jgi:hypothetical protein